MPPRKDTWPAEARIAESQLAGQVSALYAKNRVNEKYQAQLESRLASVKVLSEPHTYSPDANHSFFVDLARSQYRGDKAAKDRLARHARECEADRKGREEVRARAAAAAYEQTFYSTPADRRAMDRMLAQGRQPFERRALTRTDGQAGYFAPPGWLIDQWVPAARAGTEFASLWTQLPLPTGIDEVVVPRMVTGSATGPMADASPSPGRDLTDSFAISQVRTVAGTADASAQWLDQGTGTVAPGTDAIIFADLQADAGLNLDGQLLAGSGINSQLPGVWPAGQISTTLAPLMSSANTNSTQTWTVPGTSATSVHADLARLMSGLTRARGKHPTTWVTHPWVWDLISSTVDANSRPLVNYHGPSCKPGADESGPGEDGVLGHIHGLPLVGDTNVPTTFGGTGQFAPQVGTVTGSQFALQPGTGASALYTPLLACRPDELYLWAGEPQLRVLREVLAGTNQVRFQMWSYIAAIPNRYQALAAGTLPNSSGWSAGAASSYGTFIQQGSNSLLSITGQNF